MKLTDYDHTVIYGLCVQILNTAEGRRLGRYFTVERNKEKGDYPGMKEAILDTLDEAIDNLYTAEQPRQVR